MAAYSLVIKPSAGAEIEALPSRDDRRRVVSRIEKLSDNPRPPGSEKLAGYEDRYRVRQGWYRIVYLIDDARRTVTIVKVGHRKDVYRS